jgi:hypothetical protein
MPDPMIVLDAAAGASLRHALYALLERSIDALDTALERRQRTNDCRVWTAYMPISLIGHVIDRIGWTDNDHRGKIEFVSPIEIKIAIHALRCQLTILEQNAASEPRTAATRAILKEIEATPAAAGLLNLEHAGLTAQPDA